MNHSPGRTLRKFSLAALIAVGVAGFAPTLSAEPIKIVVGGLEKHIYLPFKLTEQLGYFKAEGLDVQLLNEDSGVNGEDEMLAGNAQGVGGFYDHCIDLQSKGKFVMSVVQVNIAPGEVELVSSRHPEFKSFADFKGMSLGVTGLGSSTNFLTKYLAVKAGLGLGEFSTIAVGAGDTFIAAMQNKVIEGGMTTEPTITRMLKTGEARVLVDMRTAAGTRAALGGNYPATALYMSSEWVEKHPSEVQKLANALVKTLRWINSHSSAEIADKMPVAYLVGDREGYIKALDYGRGMYSPDGVMPPDGPETVLKVLAAFSKNVQGKTIDLSKTYTTAFVKNVK
ncbi:MAG: ABC transporter substrate-binding protein [Alphaproteobacteria bacterium]|nr:ABC transporter substrate-binding protein [Alphaproteobacteria bacterium]